MGAAGSQGGGGNFPFLSKFGQQSGQTPGQFMDQRTRPNMFSGPWNAPSPMGQPQYGGPRMGQQGAWGQMQGNMPTPGAPGGTFGGVPQGYNFFNPMGTASS